MPTYHYVCTKCDHEFELVQSMSAPALTICPRESCPQKRWGKGKVKRVLSGGAGLIFKGSGFYITDYRSNSYKQAAKKDSESSAPKTDTSTSSTSPSTSASPSAATPKPEKKPDKPKST